MSSTEESFRTTLDSALAEDYPWHEILVPVFGGIMPAALAEEADAKGFRLLAPEALLSEVRGAYVEWLLPGETVHPEKLRGMVTCFELQDYAYPILLSGEQGDYSEIAPYLDIEVGEREAFQAPMFEWIRHLFLAFGRYPAGGLSGALVRRSVFDACGGLLGRLLDEDGALHVFLMWQDLLAAGAAQDSLLGILRDAYAGAPRKLRVEEIAMHQMDWQALCNEQRAQLDEREWNEVRKRQQDVGEKLLAQAKAANIDLAAGIWPTYRQMLAAL